VSEFLSFLKLPLLETTFTLKATSASTSLLEEDVDAVDDD
jgi:hypothetical protein